MVSKYFIVSALIGWLVALSILSFFINLNLYKKINRYNCVLTDLNPDSKTILIWTDPTWAPMVELEVGRDTFIRRKCPVTNCVVTGDKQIKSVSSFDVLIFHAPSLNNTELPQSRNPNQIYVFTSIESARNYPLCDVKYNGYFNLTWTYKLDSDIYFPYFYIKNKFGEIIGPKEEMYWEDVNDTKPIDDDLKAKLSSKTLAVAWFVSNCNTQSLRETVAKNLANELGVYNMTVDIYGLCGTKRCPRDIMEQCFLKLERHYYFYLAFENSISDDYVTEKILYALQHYTVPIVFGGANYTRFLPKSAYLNIQDQPIKALAKQIADTIDDPEKYYDFFTWRNSYSYHYSDSPDTDPFCELCAMINKEAFQRKIVYNFTSWWNVRNTCGEHK